MVKVTEAHSIIKEEFKDFLMEEEYVKSVDAFGRVTAERVYAKRCLPPCNQAAMDGIAVRAENTYEATSTRPVRLHLGEEAIFINTGENMPEDKDAVIKIEDVRVENDEVILWESVAPYQNVRLIAEDIAKGQLLFPKGWLLREQDAALCASCGIHYIKVYKLPTLHIIPTGSELVSVGKTPKKGENIESNSIIVKSALSSFCENVLVQPIVEDDEEAIRKAIEKGVKEADVICVIAGSSAGQRDVVPKVLEGMGKLLFHGVMLMPGKPFGLAKVCGKPVFCLPGYPVSCFFILQEFLIPFFEYITKRKKIIEKRKKACILEKIHSEYGMEERVRIFLSEFNGAWLCVPFKKGAGNLSSIVFANAVLPISSEKEGMNAGEEVDVILLQDEETLVFIGSDDPSLDILKEMLWEEYGILLLLKHAGSFGGLYALKRGMCHFTATHLLDPETGIYNKRYIEEICKGMDIEVLPFLERAQGLIVKKGNPLNITQIKDLLRVRFANRQKGTGTRMLLDYLLKKEGINAEDIRGYSLELPTHTATCAAVAEGVADAAIGIKVSAEIFGLDFVKLADEKYEIVYEKKYKKKLKPLFSVINSEAFRERVISLGYKLLL